MLEVMLERRWAIRKTRGSEPPRLGAGGGLGRVLEVILERLWAY